MSGISGIHFPNGRPVNLEDLTRMAQTLAHRGPDGCSTWCHNGTGLATVRLNSTPESKYDCLPLFNHSEDLALTADARLDNRDELIVGLDLQDRPAGEIGDGELILGAYRKWGEKCPEKLLGDFAFAIWDGRNKILFCARDPFGVRPFYYGKWDRGFFFASEIKALLAVPGVPKRINETRIADYLGGMLDDPVATFYQEINRLPAAHCLVISRKGMKNWRYYSLDPDRELHLSSDDEYAEAFREHFFKAVNCRMRSTSSIGVLLSGGLDSSSIACTTRKLAGETNSKILAFSTIFEDAVNSDERLYIQAVLDKGGFEPHWINSDNTGPLAKYQDLFWSQDEPFYAPNLAISWQIRSCIRDRGVRAFLDGHDGDSVVSHGHGLLKELAQNRKWLPLAKEMYGLSRVYGESNAGLFWQLFRMYGIAPNVARLPFLHHVHRIYREYLRPNKRQNYNEKPLADKKPRWAKLIQQDLIHKNDLMERRKDWKSRLPGAAPSEREQHFQGLSSGLQPYALEILDRIAASEGIEPRYPFWDRRLVEFCLGLPSEQKLHNGWSRLVLRRAMEGILPPKVQWRHDKWNFFPVFLRGLKVLERECLDELVRNPGSSEYFYIDYSALKEALTRLTSGKLDDKPGEVKEIWLAVTLALWLRWRETT